MAFEVPLDADRVDDLNLFSTFIRAPVIGTLLWILGGDKGYQAENQSTVQRLDDDHNSISDHNNIGATIGNGILATDCDSQYNSNRLTHYELISMKRHYSKEQRGNTATLKKASPSLIGSDISECEVRESLDAMCLYNNNSNINEKSCVNFVPGLKKKELSWSDEFGNNLVKYEEEVSQRSDFYLFFHFCRNNATALLVCVFICGLIVVSLHLLVVAREH